MQGVGRQERGRLEGMQNLLLREFCIREFAHNLSLSLIESTFNCKFSKSLKKGPYTVLSKSLGFKMREFRSLCSLESS